MNSWTWPVDAPHDPSFGGPLAPYLFHCSDHVEPAGAVLACPSCGAPSVHLHSVTVSEGHTGRPYRVQSFEFANPQRWVAKEQKVEPSAAEMWRGPALIIGYFCEEGCRGHLELINDGECLRARAFAAPPAASPA